jgi:hypothetical protein
METLGKPACGRNQQNYARCPYGQSVVRIPMPDAGARYAFLRFPKTLGPQRNEGSESQLQAPGVDCRPFDPVKIRD